MNLEYDEVPCPRCASLNRRFRGPPLLSGKYYWRCDHCGAELATGRFTTRAMLHLAVLHAGAFFLCAFLGVFAAVLFAAGVGSIVLGDDYERHRPAIMNAALAIGVLVGIAVAERNRRRAGLNGPMRVAAGDARAVPVPGAQDAAALEIVDISPAARARVKAKAARGFCIAIGCMAGLGAGLALARNSPVWADIGGGAGLAAGMFAGWLLGRWKFPGPR